MTKVKLRNAWFQVHKWIGIVLAIVLIPLSITGSLLVWDEPLDRLLQPSHHVESGPASFPASVYVATALKALPPGSRLVSLSFGKGPVVVTALPPQPGASRGPPQRLAAWVDPATGKLIDSGTAVSPLLRWAHVFHGSLQIPGWGRGVVGWLGAIMLVSSLTGIWLWWPLTGRVTRGFRWKRQPALDANLHHLVGFWISLPLAILSLTGVIIAWPQMIGSGGGTRRTPPTPLASPHLSVDQALAAASPRGRATVTWPTDKDGAWTIVAGRAARVQIDDASGGIKPASGDEPVRTRPLYRRLHDGTGLGFLWQLIIVLGGIAPAVLGVTGIVMWLRTRTWRGAVKRGRSEATN